MIWKRKENRMAVNSQEHETTQDVMLVAKDIPMPSSVEISKYESHPLVHSMMRSEQTRHSVMKEEGKNQMLYTKSTDGWVPSL
jgi:hypothetical protein